MAEVTGRIRRLADEDLARAIDTVIEMQQGEKSLKNIRTTLHSLLGFAVKWGYHSRMPELPDVIVPESSFDWYQSSEARQLLDAARDDWARTVLLFALHTGVRMGEQRALKWSDIDFKRRMITVQRSSPKWLVVEKSTKSNRHRRVDLTPELAEGLEKIQRRSETAFCDPDGSKLQPGQFHHILWAAQKKAGLRRIKWHELRHSFASILTSGGAPLRVVQSLSGSCRHVKPSTSPSTAQSSRRARLS